jgi:hypothetical protein
MFFSQPLPSKNPYNNLPFTKSNLYNIYIFLKFKTNIYNDLFLKFFHCDFNLTTFYLKYEYLLRQYILDNFIKNSTEDILIQEIKKMINLFNKKTTKKIIINDEFPKKRLIKIMKPYLMLHLQSYYSFVPIVKNNAIVLLNSKLKKFQKFNPKFGRKIYKLGFKNYANFKKKSYIKSVEFLDNHIAFNCNEETNFLTNHTYYNEIDNSIEENAVQVTYMTVEEAVNYYSGIVSEDEANEEDDDDDDDDDDDTNNDEIYHDYNNNDSDNDDDDEDSVS